MLVNRHHEAFSLFYSAEPIQPEDTLLFFQEKQVLLRTDTHGSRFPLWQDVKDSLTNPAVLHAFTQNTQRYFIASADRQIQAPGNCIWEDIRVFRHLLPEMDAALLNTALHLSHWYSSHRFCGSCGGKTKPHAYERALVCENCNTVIYPSVQPAIIVAVMDRGKLLLARNAQGAFRRFSLVAGFVEAGETAEQAVQREVLEETGLHIKNIRYLKSQPWGLSQSLMLGFAADLDGSPAITLQESELAEARWFPRDEVPLHDSTVSISSYIMELFRDGDL